MNILKVSSSGQITLPKIFRDKFETNLYSFTIADDKFIVIPVKITTFGEQPKTAMIKNKKTSLKDLKQVMFNSRNKKITNLSDQIDEVVYK